ncbi:GD15812 [Drosophila simulans]|uniref:GD15812 n=1 Tax=Drosophila simulans TaxID=7240 RepID=B4R557_DROSI|nr:GD15812 [Drosophila simulans]
MSKEPCVMALGAFFGCGMEDWGLGTLDGGWRRADGQWDEQRQLLLHYGHLRCGVLDQDLSAGLDSIRFGRGPLNVAHPTGLSVERDPQDQQQEQREQEHSVGTWEFPADNPAHDDKWLGAWPEWK